jgi:UDP-N-acetylglucosamine/UDP-N-acetylgalactosamine 4-epimerase
MDWICVSMDLVKDKTGKKRILVSGGAGFIGSNLIDYFLEQGHEVICLDNLSTGFKHNIAHNYDNPNFSFLEGDIRDMDVCNEAIIGCDVVTHQAALGSVPRSIQDPATTNAVNISGFLNMLIAARDEGVKRFVYAASSSTYGDSKQLPKVEEEIGKPLSPYAVTKYVNELYADVFSKTYGMQCIGLRYFNVFGKRQDPNGAYAAVIPLWADKLLRLEQPTINGDGNYSRDFTYIDNVVHANNLALFSKSGEIHRNQKEYYNIELDQNKFPNQLNPKIEHNLNFAEVFNIAYGDDTTLFQLFEALRKNLAVYDSRIENIEPIIGPVRIGDIPHSLASILKAKTILGYNPTMDAQKGFKKAAEWYFSNSNYAKT